MGGGDDGEAAERGGGEAPLRVRELPEGASAEEDKSSLKSESDGGVQNHVRGHRR